MGMMMRRSLGWVILAWVVCLEWAEWEEWAEWAEWEAWVEWAEWEAWVEWEVWAVWEVVLMNMNQTLMTLTTIFLNLRGQMMELLLMQLPTQQPMLTLQKRQKQIRMMKNYLH